MQKHVNAKKIWRTRTTSNALNAIILMIVRALQVLDSVLPRQLVLQHVWHAIVRVLHDIHVLDRVLKTLANSNSSESQSR